MTLLSQCSLFFLSIISQFDIPSILFFCLRMDFYVNDFPPLSLISLIG